MATDTTYETLQKNVQNILDRRDSNDVKIEALLNDSTAKYYQIRLDKLAFNKKYNKFDHSEWFDVDMNGWIGGDAQRAREDALIYLADIDQKIKRLRDDNEDINKPNTGDLAMAKKAVTDYQKNSPTYRAQVQGGIVGDIIERAKASDNATYIVIGCIVILGIIVWQTIAYFRNRNKNKNSKPE